MGSRFLVSFLTSLLLTVGILGSVGYAVTRVAVSPNRDVFRAGFFEFDLAPGWWCELDGTEYVCTPPGKPPHAAIAVMALKERNNDDNLDAYEAHLKQARPSAVATDGKNPLAEVRHVRRRVLGGNTWVEALHLGSEIPDYETYYLGTTTAMLGILVTLSVHKDNSAAYIDQLTAMMKTLVVYQR